MDDFLQIERTDISANLSRTYKLFQISDSHICYVDEQSTEEERNELIRHHRQWDEMKRNYADRFGETVPAGCDGVEAHILLEKLMKKAEEEKADAIVFSGDILDRVTDSNIRYLERLIKSSEIPVIYCPGNHAYIDIDGTKHPMPKRLSSLIPHMDFDTYSFDDFTVVSIDDGMKNVTKEQLNLLKAEFQKGKKIVLVIHAPLNLGEFSENVAKKVSPYFLIPTEGDSQESFDFADLVQENGEQLICVLAGHIHASLSYEIAKNLKQYTCSSGLIGACRIITLH